MNPFGDFRSLCDNVRMKKQQLYTRLGPEVVERVIRRFNERDLTMDEATLALGVSRAQIYNLRTQWLAAGKNASAPSSGACAGRWE